MAIGSEWRGRSKKKTDVTGWENWAQHLSRAGLGEANGGNEFSTTWSSLQGGGKQTRVYHRHHRLRKKKHRGGSSPVTSLKRVIVHMWKDSPGQKKRQPFTNSKTKKTSPRLPRVKRNLLIKKIVRNAVGFNHQGGTPCRRVYCCPSVHNGLTLVLWAEPGYKKVVVYRVCVTIITALLFNWP